MDGIATILDTASYEQVLSIWQEMKERCDIPEFHEHFIPHFSWHVAETYSHEILIKVLENLCGELEPFSVRTSGLGIFSGEKPVIYISLVKDARLMEIHRLLWKKFMPCASEPSIYYSPDYWMPHITLLFDDVFTWLPDDWDTYQATHCVLNSLAHRRFEWQIEVNNLAYGRMDGEKMLFQHYPFNC